MGACERRKEGMEASSIPQLPWLSGQVVEDALLCVALVHSEPGCFPLCLFPLPSFPTSLACCCLGSIGYHHPLRNL